MVITYLCKKFLFFSRSLAAVMFPVPLTSRSLSAVVVAGPLTTPSPRAACVPTSTPVPNPHGDPTFVAITEIACVLKQRVGINHKNMLKKMKAAKKLLKSSLTAMIALCVLFIYATIDGNVDKINQGSSFYSN